MRTLSVNDTHFALPDTMSIKDVQALVGFLATLQIIESHHNYESYSPMFELGRYPKVRIDDTELTPDARGKSEESYKAYCAKRDAAAAEKAAAEKAAP